MKKLLALALALWATAASATTTPNSFVTPQTPTRGFVRFLQGTDPAGTAKTIYTAGANGSRCFGLFLTNADSVAHQVNASILIGSSIIIGVSVTTVPGAGNSVGIPAQALMISSAWPGLPVDEYGNPYIQLISGDLLQMTFFTALSTGAQISAQVTCSDF